nr:hypothetical protein GCM10020093_045160 [Planobispora longispora]
MRAGHLRRPARPGAGLAGRAAHGRGGRPGPGPLLPRRPRPGGPETFDAWLYRGAARKATLRGWFRDLAPELAEVEVEGRPMVLLAEHLDDLVATEPAAGVHLLPGFDQYILGAPRDLEPSCPRRPGRRSAAPPDGSPRS